MKKEEVFCDNCICFQPIHDKICEKNGYCWYHHIPVNKNDDICKKFERSTKEERIAASTQFHQGTGYAFAGIKKRKEIDKRNLIIRIIEVSFIIILVIATIYFGIN